MANLVIGYIVNGNEKKLYYKILFQKRMGINFNPLPSEYRGITTGGKCFHLPAAAIDGHYHLYSTGTTTSVPPDFRIQCRYTGNARNTIYALTNPQPAKIVEVLLAYNRLLEPHIDIDKKDVWIEFKDLGDLEMTQY